MKVRQLMHKEVISVLPGATIAEAARRMKEEKVGAVVIVDEGHLQGIVTDRDIALSFTQFEEPGRVRVEDVMRRDLSTIGADDDIETALKVMKEHNIRRLPVKENGKLVGLLSFADLAMELREELDQFLGVEEAFAKH